jgi:hypothetical protein
VSTDAEPCGWNGVKWSALKAVKAAPMKKIRMPSLSTTMTRLALALSRVPSISRPMMTRTMNTAGMLNDPLGAPSAKVAVDQRSGIATPNADSSRALRFAPHPAATAAHETPYSRIRSQPITKATISPRVA